MTNSDPLKCDLLQHSIYQQTNININHKLSPIKRPYQMEYTTVKLNRLYIQINRLRNKTKQIIPYKIGEELW